MTYIVLASIAVRTRQGSLIVNTGQVISLPQDKAILLLHQGKIALPPELQEALEERSAIMEHDGGLSREEADKYAWCSQGQAEHCDRVTPCLRFPVNQIINLNAEVKNG
jgi:hypothetical protein